MLNEGLLLCIVYQILHSTQLSIGFNYCTQGGPILEKPIKVRKFVSEKSEFFQAKVFNSVGLL